MDGEYKVAQKAQYIGDCLGKPILDFLNNNDLEFFKTKLKTCSFMTDDEHDVLDNEIKIKLTNDHNYEWKKDNPQLYNMGASILQYINDQPEGMKLKNSILFAGDSLFCEYAYVIDFDTKKFETYVGFNKTPIGPDDRFYGFECDDPTYQPVYLVGEYDLDKLPTFKQLDRDLHGSPY